ncbi:hypothetical protein BIW11_07487 [Tropilaelaps mercedesae]|uniref:Uncharacterized protein n=1 Tax=Tropilaelaps mercedesae TaxID=418985 RepID=A0A1V9XTY8_9ACAR|nr:hypothetical protein BIW11_07487 [Tropilaelaps mercedesae]
MMTDGSKRNPDLIEPCERAVLVSQRRCKEIEKFVKLIVHRPYDAAVAFHVADYTGLGFYGATLCRLATLAALVYSVVQSGILISDTFAFLDTDKGPPQTFDLIYCITLTLVLMTAFLAIFGVVFYRAYLVIPFILSTLTAFCLLSWLLNYSLFRPVKRLSSSFTTVFPETRLNALFDIIMFGAAVYITLVNIREQVLYDLPPARPGVNMKKNKKCDNIQVI